MRWQLQANCRGVRRQVLYPEDNGPDLAAGTPEWEEECAAVIGRYCATCPVRLECYAEAREVEGDVSRGIWGGVHFVDRRRLAAGNLPVRCIGGCGRIIDPRPFIQGLPAAPICKECRVQ